jgi:3-deoxy-manno-octulosonate cytidylyltransferase (CMP-KDO synthetase)
MNAVILIPARYQSSRYPGKPLVELKGAGGSRKSLIQRSVEAARRVSGVSGVFVTTDDERIADVKPRRGKAASSMTLAM